MRKRERVGIKTKESRVKQHGDADINVRNRKSGKCITNKMLHSFIYVYD